MSGARSSNPSRESLESRNARLKSVKVGGTAGINLNSDITLNITDFAWCDASRILQDYQPSGTFRELILPNREHLELRQYNFARCVIIGYIESSRVRIPSSLLQGDVAEWPNAPATKAGRTQTADDALNSSDSLLSGAQSSHTSGTAGHRFKSWIPDSSGSSSVWQSSGIAAKTT
jgi:hypothetical protein